MLLYAHLHQYYAGSLHSQVFTVVASFHFLVSLVHLNVSLKEIFLYIHVHCNSYTHNIRITKMSMLEFLLKET